MDIVDSIVNNQQAAQLRNRG